MRDLLYLIAALPLAAAWPAVMDNLEKRGVAPKVPPPAFSSGRDQCGVHGPCAGFDEEEQFVDVTKSSGHAFQRPKSTDERGQCPGLNAAANHGFLPRNGIATIAQSKTDLLEMENPSILTFAQPSMVLEPPTTWRLI